ncbi:conjugal transfer protein TraG N-terminal domain-containing protein [Vibrio mediterranei]|uniref:conjugal transfer protein TraG N-terminal domain-containing protein n=1 Tax=Vibrio mediterranei TaxID=689 RepID=UPI00148C05DE|nr:conjugal transfer protein TraG N-terminal domain-containing protein [Vibrio mediterranei]NOI23860.1 conjugal transfer protein TraG [Vibrio mediterranei]
MNWTIYSIGDSAFLEQVLGAVAMVSGTGDFERMAATGMLIGILIISFQSVFQGATQFNLGQVFVSWLIYAMAFGAGTTVSIEDAYSGEVRVVDNVPLGPAAAGSIVSQFGYGLTRLFEVAYSPIAPGITDKRFLSSLDLISAQRNLAGKAALWAQWDKAVGGGRVDMQRSWRNYVADCTAPGYQLGAITESNIKNLVWRDALRFESSVYGTELFVSTSGPTTPTCTEGWTELMIATDTAFASQLSNETVNYLLKLSVGSVAGINPVNETTDALNDLSATGVVSSDMLKAAILSPILSDGFGQYYQGVQQTTSALMLEQAVQQRNTQWAAEQSNFMSIMRPLMTYFEGFVYAITPLAAFIVVMGGKGIQLVGKYIQTLMWIQLWMPVLSITNLYIYTRSQKVMVDFLASGGNPTSLEGILEITNDLSNELATGGMLAAATPVISLFIVTGSNYAFTSLAQRTAGADHINEKIPSPDLLQRGAALEQMPLQRSNSVQGSLITGAEGLIDQVNFSRMSGNLVSSGHSRVAAAQDSFQTQLANSFFSGNNADQSYQRLQSFGQMLRASDSSQAKAVVNAGQQYAKEHGLDGTQTNAVIGAIGARMTAGVDAGKLVSTLMGPAGSVARKAAKAAGAENPVDMRGDLTASADKRSTTSRTQMTKDLDRIAGDIGFSKGDSASLTNDVASQLSDDKSNRFTKSVGEDQRNTLTHSASQMLTAQDTFQRLSTAQDVFGSATSTNMQAVAGAVLANRGARQQLSSFMQQASPELRQAAVNKSQYYKQFGMDGDRAAVGGALYAMANSDDYGIKSTASLIASDALAAQSPIQNGHSPSSLRHLEEKGTPKIQPNNITRGHKDLSGPQLLTLDQKAMPGAGLPGGDSDVYATHGENLDSVNTQYDKNRAEFTGQRLGELRDRIMANDVAPSTSSQVFATSEGAGRFIEKLFGGAGAAVGGFSDNFGSSMNRLASMTPEQRDQFVEDARRGDEYVEQEWGVAGKALTGIASFGRGIMGAGISGYDAAKEWLTGESDLSEAAKGMSIQERGMFFASALASASEHSVEAAEQFVEQYGEEFRNMATIAGAEAGLNQTGAQLFAASLTGDDQQVANLREQMRTEVGDSELADRMSNIIQTSADAGKDQAAGYLNPVARYMSVSRGQ